MEAGADALGFVFYPGSPRYITPRDASTLVRALPPFVTTVGLFVDEACESVLTTVEHVGLDVIQLHGNEPPDYCRNLKRRVIKAFRVRNRAAETDAEVNELLDELRSYKVSACLLDTYHPDVQGGTGHTFNWDIARQIVDVESEQQTQSSKIILAGGLTPDNVAEAVRTVRPYGVDVSSGVEKSPGEKDHTLVREFIARTRQAAVKLQVWKAR